MPTNLLTANQSSFETDVSTSISFANSTIARSTAVSLHGVASMFFSLSAAQETSDVYVILQNLTLAPSTQYTWFAWVYCASDTWTEGGVNFIQEDGGAFRNIANAGGLISLPAGWTRIGGTGTTPSDWFGLSRLILRPARKADNTGNDSTKVIYYDKVMVAAESSPSGWTLGGTSNDNPLAAPTGLTATVITE